MTIDEIREIHYIQEGRMKAGIATARQMIIDNEPIGKIVNIY